MIAYPRTAGPVFGPNAPYADESIETGVNMTKEAIDPPSKLIVDGQVVVAGLSLGGITADAVQRASTPTPTARRQIG